MSTNLCVAVCDENIIGLVQASRPSTELLLCELGEGQGGGGGDEQDQERGGRGHLDQGDLKQGEAIVCLTCQLNAVGVCLERMNPTGLLVPTVVAASRAPPSVPSVRCSSARAPRLYQGALATPPMLRRPDLSGR